MDTLKIKLYRSRHGGRWDNEYLRKKGMKIGKNVQIYADKIDLPYAPLIEIGDDVIVTTASLVAHDASTKLSSDYVKIAKLNIGSRVSSAIPRRSCLGSRLGMMSSSGPARWSPATSPRIRSPSGLPRRSSPPSRNGRRRTLTKWMPPRNPRSVITN